MNNPITPTLYLSIPYLQLRYVYMQHNFLDLHQLLLTLIFAAKYGNLKATAAIDHEADSPEIQTDYVHCGMYNAVPIVCWSLPDHHCSIPGEQHLCHMTHLSSLSFPQYLQLL